MNVQGRLTDAAGVPLPPGFKSLTFKIYNASAGGAEVWPGESQFVSSNLDGVWTAMMGSVTPLSSAVFADTVRWLEITVDDGVNPPQTMPRVRLVTNPFTFQADRSMQSMTADSATHADHATFADTAAFSLIGAPDADWAVDNIFIATISQRGIQKGASGNAHIGTQGRTIVNLGIACTTGIAGLNELHMAVGGGQGNRASKDHSTVAGGRENKAAEVQSTVGGGGFNRALGAQSTIGGGTVNTAGAIYTTVAGGAFNTAAGLGGTVAGGMLDTANGVAAAVLGGYRNFAGGDSSCVGGGAFNRATGLWATIPGGQGNIASGVGSFACGVRDTASGAYSTACGGYENVAEGEYSFAAGKKAWAAHDGSFVWADAYDDFGYFSLGTNSFTARATGGVYFISGYAGLGVTGVVLPSGEGAWETLSDRNAKQNFRPVDGAEILEKLSQLSITRWNYKSQTTPVDHIGPMAQDLHRLFEVGSNDTRISTLDPDGIALAAIKELHKRNDELTSRVEGLTTLIKILMEETESP